MSRDAQELHIQVLGIGDAFTELYHPSSFAVISSGQKTLVDCPDALRRMLKEAGYASGLRLTEEEIDDVMLTHLHGDHSNGVEMYLYFKRLVQKRKPRLYGIKEVVEDLWERKLKASMGAWGIEGGGSMVFHATDYYDGIVLSEGGSSKVGNLLVDVFRTKHSVPTSALRMTHGNRTLGYSADASFDPGLIDFLEPSDMIIHEAGQGQHTEYEKLLGLPKDIRDKMFLIHLPDGFDRMEMRRLEQGRIYTV